MTDAATRATPASATAATAAVPATAYAWAGVLGPLRLDDVLFTARKSNRIAPLQVVRADRVLGPAHLQSAAWHAQRAEAEGRMQAKTVEVEFARYLAGERQIKAALAKVGLHDEAPAGVVVGLGPKAADAVDHFVHSLGLRTDPAVAEASDAKLAAFGVTPAMRQATLGDPVLAVLEMVALVDLMRS